MYVVWKKRELAGGRCSACGRMAAKRCAWIPTLVESRRVNGSPRQVHIARLTSIRSCCLNSPTVRKVWWAQIDAALEQLGLGDDDRWFAIMDRLMDKVPPADTDEEEPPARPSTSRMNPAEAAAVFGIAWPASPAELKARFRQLAKQHHPDLGGRQEDFVRVRQAFELLAALAA